MELNKNEKIEPLGSGIKVIVSDIHKFGTDTVLLANFSSPKNYERAVELGSGCGAIPLLWNRENVPKHTFAVEIQSSACNMMLRSIKLNNLENKITVLNEDLRNLKDKIQFGESDLVVCNPPYKPLGTGILNENIQRGIARHEKQCTLDDVAICASKLLRFGGRLCICLRPDRLCDAMESMRKFGIEPKRLKFVQQRKNKAPKLFLLEGRNGGRPSGLVVEPTLFVESEDGEVSDEMIKIYGTYRDNKL